jgi:hypothetical protein
MLENVEKNRPIDQVKEINWTRAANDLGTSVSSTDSSFRIAMALFLFVPLVYEVTVTKGVCLIAFIFLVNLLWFWRVSMIERGRDAFRNSSFEASLKQVSEKEISKDRDMNSDEEERVATMKGGFEISHHSSKICEHLAYIVFSAVFVFL